LSKLARELDDRHLDVLVASMEQAVTDHLAAYARLPVAAGFRDGLRQTARTYCRTLAERRRLSDKERLALHIIGSQRAGHGLGPEDMEEAVNVAVRVGWAFALRVLRQLGAAVETVEAVSVEAFPLTAFFLNDVRDGLLLGHRMKNEEQLPAQVQAQATVIDRLLAGGDDVALYEAVRTQSLDIRPPCGLLLVTASSTGEYGTLRTAATAVAHVPNALEGPGRCSAATPHVVVLASAVRSEWSTVLDAVDACARAHKVVILASQSPVDRLSELAPSYRTLEADLHLGPRARRGPGVVPRRHLAVYRMLSHVPPGERVEFVADVLGPVLAKGDKGRTYLLGYEAWVEADCDYEAAGAILNEPDYTVRYRVKKVEELTGIPVDSGEGRLHIDLAVRLLRAWVEEVLIDRHERPRKLDSD
jgi:hypothetical protein